MKTRLLLPLAVAAAALAGCATTPYSELYGYRYYVTNIDTYSVIVSKVDGKSTPLRMTTLVDPGLHKIVVQGPPTVTNRYGEEREISLDVKPCTRYYLVARKDNRLSNDFEVKIDYVEPVPGCAVPGTSAG